jgi:hypothetical protein
LQASEAFFATNTESETKSEVRIKVHDYIKKCLHISTCLNPKNLVFCQILHKKIEQLENQSKQTKQTKIKNEINIHQF